MKHKRILAGRSGGPEVLEFINADLPEPDQGEVRVKVLSAGVALADVMWLSGKVPGGPRPPYTPGYDVVGVVDRVGEGVASLVAGQMVAALLPYGGYTEYANLPADRLVRVPVTLDPAEVVCLTLNYITAYQILTRIAKVSAGARILIHGAAGGVGTAFLQLGAIMGLEVYGTASRSKHDLVISLGGTPIDYRNENFVQRIQEFTDDGVDLVVDHIGGNHFHESFKTLRRGGHLVATSSLSSLKGRGALETMAGLVRLPVWDLLPNHRHAGLYDVNAFNKRNPEWYAEDLQVLMDYLAEGRIEPVIAEKMPLADAGRALELLWDGGLKGKIILTAAGE